MYLSMCHELECMQFVSIAVNEVDHVRPHITPRTLIIYIHWLHQIHLVKDVGYHALNTLAVVYIHGYI